MPRSIWLSALVLAACQAGAWKYTDHVTLPSGYEHKGVKAVYIRAPQPDDYYDRLALMAMREAVTKRTNLFRIVESPEEAELDVVVTGRPTTSLGITTKTTAWGSGHFAVARSSSSVDEKIATYLSMLVIDRKEGEIYQMARKLPKHPNQAMGKAAYILVKMYAKGK